MQIISGAERLETYTTWDVFSRALEGIHGGIHNRTGSGMGFIGHMSTLEFSCRSSLKS